MSVELPQANAIPSLRYYIALWGIPEEFGGMTATSLYRASMLESESETSTSIITLEPRASYAAQLQLLRRQGKISAELTVHNPYQDLRRADVDSWQRLPQSDAVDVGKIGETEQILDEDGLLFCRVSHREGKDEICRREYFRPDGSTYLIDETPEALFLGTRRICLLSTSGENVGEWHSAGAFYREWIINLTAGEPSAIIIDSVFASRVFAPIRQAKIIKLVVLHNPHVAGGGDPLRGKLATGQRTIHEGVNNWDGLVFLTDEQRLDYELRFGPSQRLFTVSNPKERLPELPPFERRLRERGVVLGRLAPQKNLTHAVRIMELVVQKLPHAVLDIFGSGPQRETLQKLIDELGLEESVHLRGHAPQAADEFDSARFSLLTSRNEGQGLSLMESQGHGCPPVSYAVRYGPASIIEDGKTGFLVPPGDIELAAERIIALCSDDELAQNMGSEAWNSAESFGNAAVIKQWTMAVESAWALRPQRTQVKDLKMVLNSLSLVNNGSVELSIAVTWKQQSGPPLEESVAVDFLGIPREEGALVVVPGAVQLRESQRIEASVVLGAPDFMGDASQEAAYIDVFARVVGQDVAGMFRVGYPTGVGIVPFETGRGELSIRASEA